MESAGLFSLSHTRYTQVFFDVAVTVPAPAYNPTARATVLVLPGQPIALPWFRVSVTSAWAVTVQRLSGAVAHVVLVDGAWAVLSVDPEYGPAWTGAVAAAPSQFSAIAASFHARLEDVSMPATRGVPRIAGFVFAYAGVGLILAFFFILCPLSYMCYIARRNYALNNDLPPPFFGSMRRFRGWG
eukprot:c12678_g1_i1.p2 GENE.c12678_g1_i1~~c12678_g1_i1.p2  ORF type:complete len:217 (+),score=31.31 c12678_g1_i1:97-651(+)